MIIRWYETFHLLTVTVYWRWWARELGGGRTTRWMRLEEECGQVWKVMLSAQAQTQMHKEHGEISSSSTQDHFLPSSPLLLWAEGNETYFYVHHRLHGRHSGGPLQTWGWCLFNSHLFGRNRLELRLKSQLTLEVKFQFASKPVKELWQVKPPTPKKPKGFTAFPWLLGSVVVTGFGSDASSYYGDLGPWSKAGSVSPRLLWQLCDRSLLFEGVDERQDASLHTGRHPAGHRVAGRQRTAGLLGGRSSHQTLLIPQL